MADSDQAAAQLAALRADQVALAGRIVQPWWWDVALGLLLAGFISSYSSRSGWLIGVALLVFLVGIRALGVAYRRITGVWWDAREVGPVQGRVRRAARWWLGCYLGAMAVGAAAEFLLEMRGAMVAVGVLLGVGAALSSRWVTRIYVSGLRAGR